MEFSFFTVVHEFAILGTTFFLMALATLWYSPLLFGGVWARVSGEGVRKVFDEASAAFLKQLVVTFLAFVVEVGLLAWLLAYAPKFSVTPQALAGGLALMAAAILAPLCVFEDRPWQYYAIHTGFVVLFIVVAVASLAYWPW